MKQHALAGLGMLVLWADPQSSKTSQADSDLSFENLIETVLDLIQMSSIRPMRLIKVSNLGKMSTYQVEWALNCFGSNR